ncbi:Fe(3+) ions import ATP-binding protein FbpC [Aureimonas endophytica]|uniref:Fe(3+) ions import ATP-binding protein FbpC n=1 Tax=Aureimonas endophytica TaxID=2027858 RepID=A0A916ZHB5_9HYPH|nr:ABC transporter ATP-binding protein [Aureimonas endophytica]GGD97922.1 Fe(3+) ions import ATP-binding protein FbpC [Aureimonas endophytica]
MSFLELDSVTKRFGAVTALDGVDLRVEPGSRTAVVGPSGSGKSTLMRIVAGFEAPDEGRVRLGGALLCDGPAIVPPHRRPIGLVSQDGALFPHLDVAENIGFGLDRRAPDRRTRVLALLDMVELDRSMLHRRPHELSGGQQQRVALARALARRPKLMLLDEPFSALDTGLREALRRTVAELLASEGIAAILVTHDQAEALGFADQVAVMRDGRLVQTGAPRQLYLQPRDPATAAFLGDAVLLPGRLDGGFALCALGRIAAEGEGAPGAVRLMLRPEQLRVAPAAEAGPDAVRARVVAIEFGGPASEIRVALLEPGAAGPVPDIRLKVPSAAAPAIGDVLALRVEGAARIYPA